MENEKEKCIYTPKPKENYAHFVETECGNEFCWLGRSTWEDLSALPTSAPEYRLGYQHLICQFCRRKIELKGE